MNKIRALLSHPDVNSIDINDGSRIEAHAGILNRKKMLKIVFCEFHDCMKRLGQQHLSVKGLEIEIGAGVSALKNSYPDVLATDIVHAPDLDMVLDAESMDLPDNSVGVFYGQNCFHHFSRPDNFFAEIERVLISGGGVVLLEPYYGPFASFLFKKLFLTEGFDKKTSSWEALNTGPMLGANQALSYIVFKRDYDQFRLKYPMLEVVHHELAHNYVKYLLSGGLNFRQIIPDSAIRPINFLEKLMRPLSSIFALHHFIVIQKK